MSKKKVTSFRLSEETLSNLDEITKVINKEQKQKAKTHGIIYKEISRAEALEIMINREYKEQNYFIR